MQAYTLTNAAQASTHTYTSAADVLAAVAAGDLSAEDAGVVLEALAKPRTGTERSAEIRVYEAGEARDPSRVKADGTPMFPLGRKRIDLAMPKGAQAWEVVSLEPAFWEALLSHVDAIREHLA